MTIEFRNSALVELVGVFGDGQTASGAGAAFGCDDADRIALALIELGAPMAAVTWLVGHAEGDDNVDDHHAYFWVGQLGTSYVDRIAAGYIVERLLCQQAKRREASAGLASRH